nr:hypothetical protein [Tanacetum cinerariifolium]
QCRISGAVEGWFACISYIYECDGDVVLLLRHDTSDYGPDVSFDTSASSEYMSGLDCASLARAVSHLSSSEVPGIAKSWITCVNTNRNTTLSEAHEVSLRITFGVRVSKYNWEKIPFKLEGEAFEREGRGGLSSIGPDAPSYLEEGKRLTVAGKRKVGGKRKIAIGSHGEGLHRKAQKVPAQASKVVGDASSPLDVDSDPDIHEFPSAKELKDTTDCQWVVAHETPPSWLEN